MKPYTTSLLSPVRRFTRTVKVGDISIGGDHPVAVQSMTTTPTLDTVATVDQVQRLIEVGCPIVRITTPTMAEAENLPNIRAEMTRRGLSVPLVADVHFLPQVALKACEYVEKVRINPGNFADRKRFEVREYSESEYEEELERIREAFVPLLRKAKERGVVLRIGTNHGSLSDRIMNRFGDTALGMVESALEFVRIAEGEDFRDLVLSMKSSNTQVMIQAYRLLVARMNELSMDYPLHLGVTEAGDGEDGRIKSAVGIGSLLSDGLGDTIRVSLTEDPEREVPVAREIVRLYARSPQPVAVPDATVLEFTPTWDPYSYGRRESTALETGALKLGAGETVRVWTNVPPDDLGAFLLSRGGLDPQPEIVSIEATHRALKPELLASLGPQVSVVLRAGAGTVSDIFSEDVRLDQLSIAPSVAWSSADYMDKLAKMLAGRPLWIRVRRMADIDAGIAFLEASHGRLRTGIEVEGTSLISVGRALAVRLSTLGLSPTIHLHYVAPAGQEEDQTLLQASVEIGSLLCDGIGDSVEVSSLAPVEFNHRLSFNVLQATRLRMSKTEYIACPSCGRTLFDLQSTTARIRNQTSHLKGVKIAIMGCIVNGPGEMADADFGYVGSGPGFVNLYVGKECIERHVPETDADTRLISLIKTHGRWAEPA